MPKRIQMSRQRPWRADNPDAVRCDRNTKWGNPFKVGEDYTVAVKDGYGGWADITIDDREDAVRVFTDWLDGLIDIASHRRPSPTEIRDALGGHDLVCWCGPTNACHVDVYLERANS